MRKILTWDPGMRDMEKIEDNKRIVLSDVGKKTVCALAGSEVNNVGWWKF